MKKVIAAVGIMVTGAVMLLAAMSAAGTVSTDIIEWWSNLGKYTSAVVDNMPILIVFIAGVALVAVGMTLALRGAYGRATEERFAEARGERRIDDAPEQRFEDFARKDVPRFEEITMEIEKTELREPTEDELNYNEEA